jgi:cytochrome c peroxidase
MTAHSFFARVLFGLLTVASATGCQSVDSTPRQASAATGVALRSVQQNWSEIPAPKDNPVTQAKVELGFRLWFEPKLSGNNRMTCATCHNHTMGYSNAQPNAAGIQGKRGDRNVPTIYAAATGALQFWDGRADSLEAQALGPIENPIEMDARLPDVIRKLEAHPYYPQKFQEAFGTGVTEDGIAKAIASFERALALKSSAVDRYWAGDREALTARQKQGMAIFNSPKGRCVACHSGPDLTNRSFHNVGVGFEQPGSQRDPGRYLVTKRDEDYGAFKTPTLRNVALSAPYMHDGSLQTLEDVVAFYNRGGNDNPNLDPRIGPLGLSTDEQGALVDFLKAYTAPDNLKDLGKLPGIRNPREASSALAIPPDVLP